MNSLLPCALIVGSLALSLKPGLGETNQTIALHNLCLTQSFTHAFLDKYLKQADEPLLDNASQDPEAAVTRYGH
jgi:hypothetical protein